MMGDFFYSHKILLSNILSWFLTCLKFIILIHYFACCWIGISVIKEEQGIKRVEFVETSVSKRYMEAFYLTTTTITTVGYGDFKAFNDLDPVWHPEMILLYFVTLFGTFVYY